MVRVSENVMFWLEIPDFVDMETAAECHNISLKILKPLKMVVPAPSPPATDMKVSNDSYKCWFDTFKKDTHFTDLWFKETYRVLALGLRLRFTAWL